MTDAELSAWLASRCGLLTASRMASAMKYLANGKDSSERQALKVEILAERLTGDTVPHFVSPAMRWGLDQEPAAKAAYEIATGQMLMPCSFIRHPLIEFFGATPDALIRRDAVAEFKCPNTTTHLSWILTGGVPAQHKPQILAQLACTQRQSAVFVSFDPRIKDERCQLFIVEWTPERAEIEAVEQAAIAFLAEVEMMFQQLTEKEAA